MKLNRILLIGIILLAAISLNAISAADNTTSDIISELSIDEANDVAVESNADDSIGDSGVYNIEKDSSNAIDSPASNSLNHVDKEVNDELLGDDATKITPNLTVTPSAQSYKYGSDVILTIKLVGDENSPIDGRVAVNVANENYVVDVTKGIGDLTITGLENGTYNVVAIFNATEQYNEAINSDATFIIEKSKKVTADVEVHDVVYGETVVVTISNLKNSDGTLLSNFGGFQLVGPEHPYGSFFVRKGKGTIDLKNLPAGNYSIYIVFGNNVGGDYEFENYILDFVVEKAPVILSANIIDYKYGKEGNLNIKVADMKNKPINGKINVTIDDEKYISNVTITNGEINVALENSSINNHMAEITFYSNNYVQTDIITQFNVLPRGNLTNLSSEGLVMTYGDGSSWNVTLSDVSGNVIVGAVVKFGIEGVFYDVVTDGNGVASLPIDLSPGTYEVNASFSDDIYDDAFIREIVTVVRAVPTINITADNINYGDVLVVNVNLSEGVSRRAIVDVDGMSKLVTLKNGKGSVKFSDIHVGNQTVVVSYNGDVNYGKASVNTSVVVSRVAADIKVFASPVSYGDVLVVDVVLPEDVDGGVNVSVGDETRFISLTGGFGSVEFSDLSVGTYEVNVAYEGDENYLESFAAINAKINRAIPEIFVSVDDIECGETLTVNLQLPSDVTRRVAVTIGSDTKLVSLKEGIGSVKFMGLGVGNHEIDVVYNGDVNYMKSSVSVVAKVI